MAGTEEKSFGRSSFCSLKTPVIVSPSKISGSSPAAISKTQRVLVFVTGANAMSHGFMFGTIFVTQRSPERKIAVMGNLIKKVWMEEHSVISIAWLGASDFRPINPMNLEKNVLATSNV